VNPSFRLTFFFSHAAGGQPLRCGALGQRDLERRIGVRGKDQKRGEKLREKGVKEEGKRKGKRKGGARRGQRRGKGRGEGEGGGQEKEGGSEHKVGIHLIAKSSSMLTYWTACKYVEESRRDDLRLTIFGLAGEIPYSTIRPIILPNLLIQLHPRPLASSKLSHASKTDCPELQRRVKTIKFLIG